MIVRNKLHKVLDWAGRWTDASDRQCPCRSCYHPHDFGYSTQAGYKVRMVCLTREHGGCPNTKPEPQHLYTKYGKVCKRCGYHKQKEQKEVK